MWAEDGQVGGAEALSFGVLIFVLGSLSVVGSWSVVDQKVAVSSAARETVRAFVESGGSEADWSAAQDAGRQAYAGFGRDPRRLVLRRQTGAFRRCAPVTVTASAVLDLPPVPVLRSAARRVVTSARHTEIVDPYRSGLPAAGGNPCA